MCVTLCSVVCYYSLVRHVVKLRGETGRRLGRRDYAPGPTSHNRYRHIYLYIDNSIDDSRLARLRFASLALGRQGVRLRAELGPPRDV